MGRGIGAHTGPKAYPFVEKSPVPVRIETQSYIVIGNMYRVTYQRTWHVLEDSPVFLPLTHVQIDNRANRVRERYAFVAVNKEHILSLQEQEKPRRKASEIDARRELRKVS